VGVARRLRRIDDASHLLHPQRSAIFAFRSLSPLIGQSSVAGFDAELAMAGQLEADQPASAPGSPSSAASLASTLTPSDREFSRPD
jgi:hypothetical protein